MKARLYKTYMFRDKDPVIDHLRTAMQDEGESNATVAVRSGVSYGTINNWFNGPTRRPQFATIAAVARCMGDRGAGAIVAAIRKGKNTNGK